MVDTLHGRQPGPMAGRLRPQQKAADASVILRSWERCRDHYGIDQVERWDPVVVEGATFNACMDQYGEFVRQARSEMQSLHQQMAGSGYALLLTDARGLILDYVGDANLKRTFQGAGLWRGAIWSEQNEGTNGVGTCIAERRPVIVHGNQHFRNRHHVLSCSGAPILDPHGELFAVLDASSVNVRDTPESQFHTLALVNMSAQLIAKCRFITSFPQAMILRFHGRPEYVGLINDAALAVDGDGIILAADQNAVAYLGLPGRDRLVGHPITDILDVQPSSLLARCRRQDLPYWPVRSVIHGTRYFASVARGHEHGLPGDGGRTDPHRPIAAVSAAGAVPQPAPRIRPDLLQLAGNDPAMQRHVERARRVAGRGIPVLLRGETGTGKEVFARALHHACRPADSPFIAVNCGAIPENLIESELFGYLPGAFTGASKHGRRGKILQADKGTLFLDEIGDMPLELQTRLLRVLEEQEVVPLGGEAPLGVTINLISATHCDLAERVGDGRFREDLYYRLNGLEVKLPPLRERQDRHDLIRSIINEEGGSDVALHEQALTQMLAHAWPGNLRQLRNVLRTALALCSGKTICLDDLGPAFEATRAPGATAPAGGMALECAEHGALLDALAGNLWNVSQTARSLGMSRNTLYRKMRKHGIQGKAH